jgi:hypothetical protein
MTSLNRCRKANPGSFRPTIEALEDRWLPAPVAPLAPLPAGIAAVFTGDFNGDGKTDLAQFTKDGRWLVSLNTSVIGGATTYGAPELWDTWSPASMWRQLFVGDFNGDGKTDVAGLSISGDWYVGLSLGHATIRPSGSGIQPMFIVRGGFETGAPWAHFGTGSSDVWTKLFVADFNGDGKDDIAGFAFNGKWFVGLSHASASSTNQGTFSVGAPWADFGTGNPNVWIQTFVGDFNGDGKADIAGYGFNGNWFVGLSNGADKFSVGAPWANWGSPSMWMDPGATQNISLMGDSNVQTSVSTGKTIRLYVGDFNGDGKTDIAGLSSTGNLFVGLSTGVAPNPRLMIRSRTMGFNGGLTPWANLGNPNTITALFVGNVNGDTGTAERDDIVAFNSTSQWIVGLSQSGVTGGSDSFHVSTTPYATSSNQNNWVALVLGHNSTNYNPTEEHAHPAGFSTEFNSPNSTMDNQADFASLAVNRSWSAGVSAPTPNPNQFISRAVAVQW